MNELKIGGSAGLIILGVFVLFNQLGILLSILGILCIAFGIGLLASIK